MVELRKAPFLKKASLLSKDPLGFMEFLTSEYGDFVHYHGGLFNFYFINDADLVRDALKETNGQYNKRNKFFSRFLIIGRNGLLSSEGPYWQRQRRMLNPFFTQRSIKQFYKDIEAANQSLEMKWKKHAEKGDSFDICHDMFTLSLDVVGRSLFNLELPSFQADIQRWSKVFFDFLTRIPVPIISELWFPSPINIKLKKALTEFDSLCHKIIEDRRSTPNPPDDFLQKLLTIKNEETQQGMTDQEITEELLSFILAGHETTSHTLSWTWYWLAMNPACYRKVEQELEKIDLDDHPEFSKMTDLKYTAAAIKEALRLSPTIPVLSRAATEDTELGNTKIKKGDMVLICLHTLHRHPKYWDDPLSYQPERFLNEESEKNRHKHAYIPFGGGPRFCIGNNFAMLEMIYTLSYMMKRFRIEAISPEKCQPLALLTLQIKNGMMVTVKNRL